MKKLRWNDFCREDEFIHLARVSAPQKVSWQLHSHDFYECFHIEAGRGFHLSETGRSPLSQGMLVFIRPEHVHGFNAPARRLFVLTNVAMKAPAVERFIDRHAGILREQSVWQRGNGPGSIQLNPLTKKRFDQLIDNLAWGNRGLLDAEFFLSSLFRLISVPKNAIADAGIPDWMQNAMLLMDSPGNLQAGSARLVELCGRTAEHVSRSFRRFLGQSPSQWITAKRIRYARQLLDTSELAVSEIAYECGFENLSYFHRCFRTATGQSPRGYRNQSGRNLGVV